MKKVRTLWIVVVAVVLLILVASSYTGCAAGARLGPADDPFIEGGTDLNIKHQQ